MTESRYDCYLCYRYKPFAIISLETNDTLILPNNTLTIIEKEAIMTIEFIIKKKLFFYPKRLSDFIVPGFS